jgi:hypothetical protein
MAQGARSFQRFKDSQPRGGGTNLFTGPRGALYFKIPDGGQALVRFLHEGDDFPTWCWVHKVPGPGRQYPDDVVCINQDDDGNETGAPCPGCERDVERKFKGWTQLIWHASDEAMPNGQLRYEQPPVYAKDEKGQFRKNGKEKIIQGYASQVAIWSSGPQLFDDLTEKDDEFKGLTTRLVKVKRGTSANGFVKYTISPADIDAGKMEFTADELKIAEGMYDLSTYTQKPSYDDFMAKLTGAKPSGGNAGGQQAAQQAARANPFMRNRG